MRHAGLCGALASLALVIAVPSVRAAFQFIVMHPIDIAGCKGRVGDDGVVRGDDVCAAVADRDAERL